MQDFLFVKDGVDYFQVFLPEVLYIESKDKYINLVTAKKEYLIRQSLNAIEKELPVILFCRVHRSYIISFYHTKRFNGSFAMIGDKKIPVGKEYREAMLEKVQALAKELKYFSFLSHDNFSILLKNIRFN